MSNLGYVVEPNKLSNKTANKSVIEGRALNNMLEDISSKANCLELLGGGTDEMTITMVFSRDSLPYWSLDFAATPKEESVWDRLKGESNV